MAHNERQAAARTLQPSTPKTRQICISSEGVNPAEVGVGAEAMAFRKTVQCASAGETNKGSFRASPVFWCAYPHLNPRLVSFSQAVR